MPNRIYRLKVSALCTAREIDDVYDEINVDDIYDDYETARHEYESWKYDERVKDNHGYVSLVEMGANEETRKFEVTRELGDKQW